MSATALAAAFAFALSAPTTSPPPGAAQASPPASSPARAATQDVVSLRLSVPDGDGPAIEAGVWLPGPSFTGPRPLVVISHGSGGDFQSHRDTAEALARAGFVVASLTHTGDNWRDQSQATNVVQRPRQLSVLIDYMVGRWEGRETIDPDRIGAFGFSFGGFTVLTAAGGEPDMSRIAEHCRARPAFYDCRLMSARPAAAAGATPAWTHDARLRAVVAAAPALGFTFTREGLAGVTQPVQLWKAGADQILPAPFYAEPVRDALPRAPEFHQAEGAGHFDFLPPCTAQLAAAAPIICTPTPGFDRAAFHEDLNREVVRFFQAHL